MKKSHNRVDLQKVNKVLALSSHDRYCDLMLSLCNQWQSFEESVRLRPLLLAYKASKSGEDAIALLDCADSLSSAVHDDAMHHYIANQFAALIKKYPFPIDKAMLYPEARAYAKFVRAETTCRRFNLLFKHVDSRRVRSVASPYVLDKIRSFCTFVLGERPNLERIYDKCGFGPGANIGIHGYGTHVKRKLLSSWSVSPGAFNYARHAILNHAQIREIILPSHGGFLDGTSDPLSSFNKNFLEKICMVDHNNISFVPKTSKIFRSIAVEPVLNSYVQKGIDEDIRGRLRDRVLIDLSDQHKNSEMAREGSLDSEDGFVTIDLSSASDSISIEFCRQVLPPDWFDLLDRTRSKSYSYKGQVHTYSKFCSMGNGFCFPLQTLLFAGMCNAVGAGRPGIDFRVYGDDIVVRKPYATGLISLLRMCGFRTNVDKTFVVGPFRESCGKDYFRGVNVRPVYLDYALDSVEALFKFHNSTIEVSALSQSGFSDARSFLREQVPERWRFVRPISGPADSAFTVDIGSPPFMSSRHARFSPRMMSWHWKELLHSPVDDRNDYDSSKVHLAMLYGALSGLPSRHTFTYRRKTVPKVRLSTHGYVTSLWLPPSSP